MTNFRGPTSYRSCLLIGYLITLRFINNSMSLEEWVLTEPVQVVAIFSKIAGNLLRNDLGHFSSIPFLTFQGRGVRVLVT